MEKIKRTDEDLKRILKLPLEERIEEHLKLARTHMTASKFKEYKQDCYEKYGTNKHKY